MVVYADILFLTNFISAYIMLCLLGKLILKTKLKLWRMLLASAAAAVMATVLFSLKTPPFPALALRLLSAVIPVFTAFYDRKGTILSQIMWLGIMSVIMVGIMIILPSFLGKTGEAVIKNGIVYINLPVKIFIPMFLLSYVILTVILKIMGQRRQKRLYNAQVTYKGKKMNLTALFDSGNSLRDGITGKSVSLIDKAFARRLLGADDMKDDISEWAIAFGLRCIPFRGAEGKGSCLFAFKADIFIKDEEIYHKDTLIGIYDGRLSNKNEYNALLNSALL